MKTKACLIVLACLLAPGCNRNSDGGPAEGARSPSAPPASADFGLAESSQGERTWVGLLPCRDCQGIDTRLVLRHVDGRRDYLMTETYLGGPGKNSFDRAGTWTEANEMIDGQPTTLYILDPDRGRQRFFLQSDGALEMLDGDDDKSSLGVAYRLQRL